MGRTDSQRLFINKNVGEILKNVKTRF